MDLRMLLNRARGWLFQFLSALRDSGLPGFGKRAVSTATSSVFLLVPKLKGAAMLRIGIYAVILLAPFLVYGAMSVRESFVVNAAVAGERKAGIARCKGDILAMEAQHNSQVDAAASEARDAGEAVETPDTDQEIIALCKRSASCRSRGTL